MKTGYIRSLFLVVLLIFENYAGLDLLDGMRAVVAHFEATEREVPK